MKGQASRLAGRIGETIRQLEGMHGLFLKEISAIATMERVER
jgi:hypothetical protein